MLENVNLTSRNERQEVELNNYADQEFVRQARHAQGGNREHNISRSGGPPRFDGVDPQSNEDATVTVYDINDVNTSYYLAPLSYKDLGTP